MPNHPPPFPEITDDVLHRIAASHHLNVNHFTAMPQIGIVNKLYLMGEDLVIRIGRAHPKSVEIAEREALAVSVAKRAGVRTPDLLVCDVSMELIPAAFTVYGGFTAIRWGYSTWNHSKPPMFGVNWAVIWRDYMQIVLKQLLLRRFNTIIYLIPVNGRNNLRRRAISRLAKRTSFHNGSIILPLML